MLVMCTVLWAVVVACRARLCRDIGVGGSERGLTGRMRDVRESDDSVTVIVVETVDVEASDAMLLEYSVGGGFSFMIRSSVDIKDIVRRWRCSNVSWVRASEKDGVRVPIEGS